MSYTYLRKAHYHETDQMGIIHHSNYIKWFEEARIAYMNHVGMPYNRMEEEGILSPVINVSCDYLSMVEFEDEVYIHVVLQDYNGVKFSITYEVTDDTGRTIYARGTSKHCFIGVDKRLVILKKVKPEFHALFENAAGQ